jgi:hypothetical protein
VSSSCLLLFQQAETGSRLILTRIRRSCSLPPKGNGNLAALKRQMLTAG